MSRIETPRALGRRQSGFSLVEMTTTIVITGILAVGLSNLLQHPMNGYAAVSRRAELVALGDLAISRLVRDLELALPNSIRISPSGDTLELLLISAGGRYRAEPGINDVGGPNEEDHSDASDWLSFGGDTSFNLLGRFQSLGQTYGAALAAGSRISVYPTDGSIWNDAALDRNPSAITPGSTAVTVFDDADEDQIRLSADHTFQLESPNARFFLVRGPLTYLCDTSEGSLWRIDGYPIRSIQPTDRTAAPLSAGAPARAASMIETCRFTYVPGASARAALVTIELVLENAGERVRLLQQVQVRNAP